MCYNCGCFNPADDMGNPDNLTEAVLTDMAAKQKMNLHVFKTKLLNNLNSNQLDPEMEAEFAKAAKAWGQSVEEAKKNAQDLLKTEVK